MADTIRKIWHRQHGESDVAYAAFQVYLEMGSERTFREAYRQHVGNPEATQAAGYFSQWTLKFKWAERVEEYEAWLGEVDDDERRRSMRAQQKKIAERRRIANDTAWRFQELLFEKAAQILAMPMTEQTLDRDGVTIILKPVRFRLSDAARMIHIADRLARLATDMSTDNVTMDMGDELRCLAEETGVPYEVLVEEYRRQTGQRPDGTTTMLPK